MPMHLDRSRALDAGPLEQKLKSYAPLTAADIAAVRACAEDLKSHPSGTEIGRAGQPGPRVVVSGWAAWQSVLADGRRQIVQLVLPGDVIGLPPLASGAVTALTVTRTVDAGPLVRALADPERNGLSAAWEAARHAERRRLVDQVVRLGRRSAYERLAHLVMELMERQRRAGLAERGAMPWALTQEALADVLGLSIVHVNRTLQQLRRDGLIALRGGRLTAPDLDRLAHVAGWDDPR